MAVLTTLSLGDARRLGALYGLHVAGVSGVPRGSVNSNHALELPAGARAFLRIYEEQGREGATLEAALLERLASAGVPTPRPLRRKDGTGGALAEHAGKPVAVFPWVDGDMLCQAAVTPGAVGQVGAALAKVHLAGADLPDLPPDRFGALELRARLAKLVEQSLGEELDGVVALLARRLAEVEGAAFEGPSRALIHGDLFRDNVLWSGGRVAALLDFESASAGAPTFDVAVTMLAWCYVDRLEVELVRALWQGYTSVRPVSADERARLFPDALFAAVRFSITRVTDFELRPRGTGTYKDYRRFLGRLAALDALGPDGLARMLEP